MAIYKYLNFRNLERVLNGSVRLTQPGAFNDPFEMVPEVHVPVGSGGRTLDVDFSVTAPRRERRTSELRVDFESDRCNDATSRDLLLALNKTIGIFCMTRNPASLVMWAHYADQYAGGVLEFDEAHEFFRGLIDVEYRANRPKKDLSHYVDSSDPIPIAELCAKPQEWSYESEVRIVRELSDCRLAGQCGKYPVYVMDIPRECIRAVTLGERMSVDNQRKIWEQVQATEVSLYLAAIANWEYEFRREPIKIPGMGPMISPRTAHIFSNLDGDLGKMARWQIQNNRLSKLVNTTL